MRVITGIAKKKPLKTLKESFLRPTTEKVKEAMFSIIQFKINSTVVLDLFAGSGQLGIEAISRGAKCCTFVDSSIQAHKVELLNLKNTKLEKNAKVIISDALTFLKNTKEKYDIIFLDPPFHSDLLIKSLQLAEFKLTDRGIIICEHMKNVNLPNDFKNISLQKQYQYGKINLTFYENRQDIV